MRSPAGADVAAQWKERPRRFVLHRVVDVTGISGVGEIAEGVEWTDGTVALRWRGKWATTVVWDYGMDALLAVHGRHGNTAIRWLDRTDGADSFDTCDRHRDEGPDQ